MAIYNPFAHRADHSRSALATYRTLTLTSWALAVVVSVYYSVRAPRHGHTLAGQNRRHPTAFSPNIVLVDIYWALLFASQATYVAHVLAVPTLTSSSIAAVAVGSHFVVNNLLHAAWVLAFATGHFVVAELLLLANLVNLTALYLRHPAAAWRRTASDAPETAGTLLEGASNGVRARALVHLPAVAGPLAWTFVAIYWNGAVLAPYAQSLPLRILANLFVWSLLAFGLFFMAIYGDDTMGFCLALLAAALGVGQFLHRVIALQWIFAFTVMSLLFVAALAVAVPQWLGRATPRMLSVRRDGERAPLLGADA